MFFIVTLIFSSIFLSKKSIYFGFSLISFFYYRNLPITFNRISELFFTDTISSSLVFMRLWVVLFIALTTPNNYQYKPFRGVYYLLLVSFFVLAFYRFSVNNLFVFYFLFEASLIPTFLIIAGWGYQIERVQAIFYFLLYTIVASLPLLIWVTSLGIENLTYFSLSTHPLNYLNRSISQILIGLTFTLAFLSKIPIYLVHL